MLGTLVTLWPTMLRTRIADGAEQDVRRAPWPLLPGSRPRSPAAWPTYVPAVGLGMLAYAGGLIVLARPFVSATRRKAPVHFPTWSVLAAVCWLTVLVTLFGAMVAR